MTYPRAPAAFINTIHESGSKHEAVQYLQQTWNEVVALRRALRQIAEGDNDPRRVAHEALTHPKPVEGSAHD